MLEKVNLDGEKLMELHYVKRSILNNASYILFKYTSSSILHDLII